MVDEILYQSHIVRAPSDFGLVRCQAGKCAAEADSSRAQHVLILRSQHPSHPASHLAQPAQSALFATLHQQISTVTRTAVSVDADASRFPDTWLFQFRWGKGKKKAQGDEGFKLVRSLFCFPSHYKLALRLLSHLDAAA